jgi:hypothetical protein
MSTEIQDQVRRRTFAIITHPEHILHVQRGQVRTRLIPL